MVPGTNAHTKGVTGLTCLNEVLGGWSKPPSTSSFQERTAFKRSGCGQACVLSVSGPRLSGFHLQVGQGIAIGVVTDLAPRQVSQAIAGKQRNGHGRELDAHTYGRAAGRPFARQWKF